MNSKTIKKIKKIIIYYLDLPTDVKLLLIKKKWNCLLVKIMKNYLKLGRKNKKNKSYKNRLSKDKNLLNKRKN
jgi:hypothetical protein